MSVIEAVLLKTVFDVRYWNTWTALHKIGLAATSKETDKLSNSYYFGDPAYTYTLKQGIKDGFLAPYKVIWVDIDMQGWRLIKGQTVTSYLEHNDTMAKTIVL